MTNTRCSSYLSSAVLILGSVFVNYMQMNKGCKEFCQLATLLCYKCGGFLQELFSNLKTVCLYYVPLNLNKFGKAIH